MLSLYFFYALATCYHQFQLYVIFILFICLSYMLSPVSAPCYLPQIASCINYKLCMHQLLMIYTIIQVTNTFI